MKSTKTQRPRPRRDDVHEIVEILSTKGGGTKVLKSKSVQHSLIPGIKRTCDTRQQEYDDKAEAVRVYWMKNGVPVYAGLSSE